MLDPERSACPHPQEPATGLLWLVLGGVRSGKSRFALAQAEARAADKGCVYIATASRAESLDDPEMTERIARHRAARGNFWHNVEEPLALAQTLRAQAECGRPILVDCLTLWLSNLMAAGRDLDAATVELLGALESRQGDIFLVSNEVGLGIVPENALARRFRDAAGTLHQALAEKADRVVFITAGLPTYLKGGPA